MNQKRCNILAISSLILGILRFLSVSAIIVGVFVIKSWGPIAFHFFRRLNLTLSWSWSIILGILALKMIARDVGNPRVRKSAVFGIVLGIISGMVEIGIIVWFLIVIKIYGF